MADPKVTHEWFATIDADKLSAWIEKNGEAAKKRHHTDDVYFAVWMHQLNIIVRNRTFMSYDDLEDWDYWMAYDAGMSPREAAGDMLEDLGYAGRGE